MKISFYHTKTLIIIIALASFMMITDASAYEPSINVYGVVKDSLTNEILPFATLQRQGERKSVVADKRGEFRISEPGETQWQVSYAGYNPKTVIFRPSDRTREILLVPMSQNLSELVVKPKKEKYSKKNNPAVDFVRKIRGGSKDSNPIKEAYYSYDKYEKTLIAVNNYEGDFSKGFLAGKGKFLKEYVDTSSWTGKRLLDLMLKEKVSTKIFRNEPHAEKEVMTGYRGAGVDEVISQENMQVILEDVIREIDIYGNDVVIMQNRFVSPLSAIGPDFYKYFLTDTVYIEDEKCVELSFAPHNPESMGFNGKIYVPVGDSTMFVKKVSMRVPHDINLNYVDNLYVNQRFEKDSLGNRNKVYDDVCIEMSLLPGVPKLYGRKTTVYDNFSYDKRDEFAEYYDKLGHYFDLDESRRRESDFWETQRMVPLTSAESRMGGLMKDMRTVPLLYWGEKFLSLMESGYVKTGNPSKVDLGPLNTLFSGNTVEGLRMRFGGMTMSPLNQHLFASGYVAYGTRDHKVKYGIKGEYSFSKKKHHSYEWPRHGFFGEYSYDLDMLGQHYLFTSQDNVFLSLKRKESVLVTYRRLAKLGYVLELPSQFSVEASIRRELQESTPWVPFRFRDGSADRSFSQSAIQLTLRWAPGEKFVQGRTLRLPVNMDAWIIQLTHEYGPKGFLGSAFTLNRTELSVQKRLWLSAFGYFDMIVKAGKIWSEVYYPALMWPNANLSYTIQPESYSLMNPMEFANDKYASVDFTYFGNGVLFNRLPLIKKLKIREAITFKGLIGGLSDCNNPEKNMGIYLFPEDAHSRVMGKQPYMEIGAGLDNILTFLRVDYIWRLSYLDNPGIDKRGVRVSLHFSF